MTEMGILYIGLFLVSVVLLGFFIWFCLSLVGYLKSITSLLDEQNDIIADLKSKEKSTKKDEK